MTGGMAYPHSAKTLLVAVLLYHFVSSNLALWYLAGSAVFYALMATNVALELEAKLKSEVSKVRREPKFFGDD